MGYKKIKLLLAAAAFSFAVKAQKPVKPPPPLSVQKNRLVYVADSLGNIIPDFSYCGYKASEQEIPDIAVKVVVPVIKEDATIIIQRAIDYVAGLMPDKTGFRGAVLLEKGTYNIAGQLQIKTSGVVLRGSGTGATILLATGASRDALIRISGKNDITFSAPLYTDASYVPVNAQQLQITNGNTLKTGDEIIIKRPSTKEWIADLGTDHFGGGITSLGWKPGDADIYFYRTITNVSGNTLTIDVPLTTALEKQYGGGIILPYQWPGRIENTGVENLSLQSVYDSANEKDENHRWMAITIENAQDVWVRQVNFKHFAGSAVFVLETARRVTVEDCLSLQPVSEIGGQRRYTFFTRGQQTLFQRCYAEQGYHDFATGHAAAGPNAFVQCVSYLPYSFSGGIDKWGSGILYDVVFVDGNAIRLGNRGQDGQGAGWAAANSVLWNCSASLIDCYKPPTAQNWSFGSWSQFAGNGYWNESNNHLTPRSLFYTQLKERLQKDVSKQAAILDMGTEASSSPSVEVAQQLDKEALNPKKEMKEWIAEAAVRNPINTHAGKAININTLPAAVHPKATATIPLQLLNGWMVKGNAVLTGRRQEVPWWSGGAEARDLEQARSKLAITRFVPGRVGPGLTDDIDELTDTMLQKNIMALEQHYALWYERRRDDHERIRRMDGDVWPPFYELPFARSGQGTAWDGLSKYDLTKYNTWYWNRMQQFSGLADEKGLVLIYQHYFQHNIIEAGAHYADFPWRTANNINNTGFNEPVNYAGDKRIFYASQFYDVTNKNRNTIHQQYIHQSLDNFKNNTNVIHFISEEYTGPLSFVQLWLDNIQQWLQKNKKTNLIGLSATKDVQDAILKNAGYAALIDVIDIKYWHYQADGTVYAPEGGKNLAPRQWARLLKPKATSFEQVYRAVSEYKQKFPAKAVMYSGDNYPRYAWAVFMAGGSFAELPAATDKNFLQAAIDMQPDKTIGDYALSGKEGAIIYGADTDNITLDLTKKTGSFKVQYINPSTGKNIGESITVNGGKKTNIRLPQSNTIVWLSK